MVPTQDAKKVKRKDTKKKRIRQDHKSVSLCSLRYLLALLQSFGLHSMHICILT
jgi:hypothetical protein